MNSMRGSRDGIEYALEMATCPLAAPPCFVFSLCDVVVVVFVPPPSWNVVERFIEYSQNPTRSGLNCQSLLSRCVAMTVIKKLRANPARLVLVLLSSYALASSHRQAGVVCSHCCMARVRLVCSRERGCQLLMPAFVFV